MSPFPAQGGGGVGESTRENDYWGVGNMYFISANGMELYDPLHANG